MYVYHTFPSGIIKINWKNIAIHQDYNSQPPIIGKNYDLDKFSKIHLHINKKNKAKKILTFLNEILVLN